MQAALEFDRPDAVEGRPDPQQRRNSTRRPAPISTPCSSGPEASNVQVTQQFNSPQQGNFNLKVTGSRDRQHHVLAHARPGAVSITATGEVIWGIKKLNLALALDNTGSMSSSNKMTELKNAAHNLLDHAQEGREEAGRHQGRDRAVRGRRQCRHRQRQCRLDRLDGLGSRERHLQQSQLHHQEQLHVDTTDLDAQEPQHLERLRHGPRPEQRRTRRRRPAPAPRPCSAPIRRPTARRR